MYVLMINKGIPSATCISGSVCKTFWSCICFMESRAKLCLQLHHCPLHGVYRRDFCVLFNQSSIQGIFLTPLHLRFSPKEIDAISYFLRELDALSTKLIARYLGPTTAICLPLSDIDFWAKFSSLCQRNQRHVLDFLGGLD